MTKMPQKSTAPLATPSPTPAPESSLSTLILLNSQEAAEKFAPIFRQHNEVLNILVATSIEALRAIPPEVLSRARLISICGSHIVPAEILRALGFSAFNFHPGPPSYPGWAPLNFALYDGVTGYGTTLHRMTERVDAGPIVALDLFPVPPDADIEMLSGLVRDSIGRLIQAFAKHLATSTAAFPAVPIPWARSRTTKRAFAAHCAVGPDIERRELLRRVRAFGPGDGHTVPNIDNWGYRFVLWPEPDGSRDDCGLASVDLHGIRFVLASEPDRARHERREGGLCGDGAR